MSQPVFRIAPTPSGYLHDGNAANFLVVWILARLLNGRILLRIDDLDRARFRTEYLNDIFRTIDWLGIDIDFGPSSNQDFHSNWSQHKRMEIYEQFIEYMQEDSRVYPCSCTRSNLKECNCRQIATHNEYTENSALKFHVESGRITCFKDMLKGDICINTLEITRDFIIRKKDGLPSYHLASVADDIHFGITHIVRGADLMASTIAQVELCKHTPWSHFSSIKFFHHELIRHADGNKLSKSAGDTSGRPIEKSEIRKAALCMLAANFLGKDTEAKSPEELLNECRKEDLLL